MSAFDAQFPDMGFTSRLYALVTTVTLGFALVALTFAALAVAFRWINVRKARRWQALETEWEAGLLDLLAGDIGVDAFRGRVAHRDALYFVDYLSQFARRLRGAERVLIAQVAPPYLPRVAKQVHSRQATVRARAVRTLGLLGLRDYSYAIIAALDDPSPLVAMTAARQLAQREPSDFAPAVLLKLHRFQHWSPGFLTAMLAAIGPDAAPFLRAALADERELSTVRAVAADALRAVNDLTAADLAGRIASQSSDRELVAASLRLLRSCGEARHTGLVRVLARHGDDVIRAHALAALGTLGDADDIPLLVAAIGDASVWVAWPAARSLAAIGGRAALEGIATSAHVRADLAREVLLEPT